MISKFMVVTNSKTFVFFGLLIFAVAPITLFSQTIQRGPYLVNFSFEDPVNPGKATVTVCFQTSQQCTVWVDYKKPGQSWQTKQDSAVARTTHLGTIYIAWVTVSNLDRDAVYEYKVRTAADESDEYAFRTFSENKRSFSFIAVGDSRGYDGQASDHAKAIVRTICDEEFYDPVEGRFDFTGANRSKFVIHDGDFTNQDTLSQWGTHFFEVYQEQVVGAKKYALISNVCFVPCPGNHEDADNDLATRKQSPYYAYFTSADGTDSYYAIDYGVLRVISLNATTYATNQPWPNSWAWQEDLTGPQKTFLENQVATVGNRWCVVFFHHPFYNHGAGHGRCYSEQNWDAWVMDRLHDFWGVPILNSTADINRAHIVFAGHDHNYQKIYNVGGQGSAMTRYVITGGGGAPCHGNGPCNRGDGVCQEDTYDVVFWGDCYHYCRIEVGTQLKVKIIKEDGTELGTTYQVTIDHPPQHFWRANAKDEDNVINDEDSEFILHYLFAGGPQPNSLDSADANDDGAIDIADPIYILQYLSGGPKPPEPFEGGCGVDPSSDDLWDSLLYNLDGGCP